MDPTSSNSPSITSNPAPTTHDAESDHENTSSVAPSATTNFSHSRIGQSGYNIDLFIDEKTANKYLCSICHHVVADCYETQKCGHIFCAVCIKRALISHIPPAIPVQASSAAAVPVPTTDTTDIFRCPLCNVSNSSPPRQSLYLNRAVSNLKVRCPFYDKGCEWIGTLLHLKPRKNTLLPKSNGHLNDCLFIPLICEDCQKTILKKDKKQHVCKKKQTCLSVINKCPNCNEICSNSDHNNNNSNETSVEEHLEFWCPKRKIQCPFFSYGCTLVIEAGHLNSHLKYNSQQHFQQKIDYSINKMEKMKIQMKSMLTMIEETKYNQILNNKKIEQLQILMQSQSPNMNVNASNAVQAMIAGASIVQAPDILFLIGSNKWEETGVFIRRSILHEKRVCYTSFRTRCAIRWNSDLNAWLIDRRGLAKDNEASLIAYQDVIHPGLVNHMSWLVYNDDIQEWEQSKNYSIQSFNLAEFLFKADQIFASVSSSAYFGEQQSDVKGGVSSVNESADKKAIVQSGSGSGKVKNISCNKLNGYVGSEQVQNQEYHRRICPPGLQRVHTNMADNT